MPRHAVHCAAKKRYDFMDHKSNVTIIVPVFNERKAVGPVLDELIRFSKGRDVDIIVVDDGSDDGTADILADFSGKITLLRHRANRGYGAALKTGILASRAGNVLFFDSDGQHDVKDIPAILSELEHHECVFGARTDGAGIPLARKPGKWLLRRICRYLAGQKIPDINCGLRAGRRHLFMRMLDLLPEGFSFSITSLMYVIKSRYSHIFVPVQCKPRTGRSSVRIVYEGVKAILLALRLVMLFDPLRTLGIPAVAFIAIGILYQVYIIATYRTVIVGGALLSILAGIILFLFGLLADQVASLRKEISSHNSLYWERNPSLEGDGDAG